MNSSYTPQLIPAVYKKWPTIANLLSETLFNFRLNLQSVERRCGVLIPLGTRDFSVLQIVQRVSGAHPASCSIGTGYYPGCKTARA